MHNDQLLLGLNEAQQRAVLHGEGPALVAAGPGSGKTTCLTRRILYLVQECHVPPQKILVLTFTKEAAKTMQSKYKHLLTQVSVFQSNMDSEVTFATLHSFSYQIIQNISKYSEYQIITKQEKKKIAKEVFQSFSSEEVTESELNTFLNRISYSKNTGIFQKNDHSLSKEENVEEEKMFRKYFKAFGEKMHAYHRMDFDDMLYLCKQELTSSKELLWKYRNKYSYVLVDEFQDLNTVQYEILRLLCKEHKNLYVVGDDDQAIYGFRGSCSDIFQMFQKDFPNTKLICLGKNYRCGKSIVNASKSLIEHNKLRIEKELEHDESTAVIGSIHAFESGDFKECVERIMTQLREQSPDELQEKAILFRTNFAMQTLASSLTANHIPFILREKTSNLYEHFVVHDVMDYFEAAHGNHSRELFIRIFRKLRIPLGREALRTKEVSLQKVIEVYEDGFYENSEAKQMLSVLAKNLQMLQRMKPALGIKFILHAMEYNYYLRKKSSGQENSYREWQEIVEWLCADAEDFYDYKAWKTHQTEVGRALEKQAKKTMESQKGIHLLTLHAAKGLEFKKVFILNVNEGNIPAFHRGEILTKERLEEERRLFYVGITRARDALELHYLSGTQERPKFKSRFLEELKLPQKAADF